MVNRNVRLGLAVVAVLAPQRAALVHAHCYASDPSYAASVAAPPSGATDVPTDTRIWLGFWVPGYSDVERDTVLVGPGGDEVALGGPSVIAVPVGEVEVWKPEQPLQPDSDYQVWSCDLSFCDRLMIEFRTGAGPSAGPPPVPVYLGEDPEYVNGRGKLFARFDFQGILVVDRASGDFADLERGGQVVTVSARADEPVELSRDRDDCGNWPSDDSKAALRFGAYDWSGRFSGWSEPSIVEVRGCAVVGPGPLALVVLCALRRRRPARAR